MRAQTVRIVKLKMAVSDIRYIVQSFQINE